MHDDLPSSENSGVEQHLAELGQWLEENWDPDLSVGEWWDRLGRSGWSAPSLPVEAYGRGLSRQAGAVVAQAITRFGALGAPGGLGLQLAAPTIAKHGTPAQVERYVLDIVTGQKAWCQLFSEPSAGSDLAGLNTRAVRDEDGWFVNGQKVWTSNGHFADLGMLIARTDPTAPKHRGLTYFAIDMTQAGVDVRPLREMTGRAQFNEVFLSDAFVADDAVIGDLGQGWGVANSTLAFERAGLGPGAAQVALAKPGTIMGHLDQRAGDFVDRPGHTTQSVGPTDMFGASEATLIELAKRSGAVRNPVVRQDLMRLHSYNEIARFSKLRQEGARDAGVELPGAGNLAKVSMTRIWSTSRDLGLRLLQAAGTLHAYTPGEAAELNASMPDPLREMVTEMALFAPGTGIYGGTDEIQRNIIGERVLGLPKEPSADPNTPFNELRPNG